MKAQKNNNLDFVVTDGVDRYVETKSAQATSRVLEGSSDHGYWMEYVGYGKVDGVPVKAVYLLGYDQENIEDECDYDWDSALENGRIEVVVDDLDDEDYDTLVKTGELTI